MTTVRYCSNASDIVQLWSAGGLSRCFADTLIPSIALSWIVLLGGAQIAVYRKYSIATEPRLLVRTPFLLRLQILCHVILVLEAIVRFSLQYLLRRPRTVYGSDIIPLSLTIGVCFALFSLVMERRRVLSLNSSRGHGVILLVFWALLLANNCLSVVSWRSPQWWWLLTNEYDRSELAMWIVRTTTTSITLVLGIVAPGVNRMNYNQLNNVNEDQADALLQDLQRRQTYLDGLLSKFKLIWPFIWPRGSLALQIRVILLFLLLAVGRGVNLLIPLYYKQIVNSLTKTGEKAPTKLVLRWELILVYMALKFLQGGGIGTTGFLDNMRTFLWIRVEQYTTKQISVELYEHIHGLSLRWHLGRKTGEVLRVMDRGTNSINNILSNLVFNLLPTLVDILIAIVYFMIAFNPWFGLIVFVSMLLYLISTFVITEWRIKYRRAMNQLDKVRYQKGVDSLLNFETVKYYGAESFEIDQYSEAMINFQKSEWISTATLNGLNTVQNVILTGGFLTGTLLCAHYVVEGWSDLTVGDFVLFATYMVQMYNPLSSIGNFYRVLQTAFIDMENMFDLLHEEKEVKDIPDAPDLDLHASAIEFENVSFHYLPGKQILNNITFKVPEGKTVALVGPSGSGKSTIIRLLFRFYDVLAGTIRVDGKDISLVTQKSLRQCIGVVPQDTVLFNAAIRYNIRYGRTNATDEEVMAAAAAADIHQRILTFPDKYDTAVGERGLKLSGGEKQRVAIARTILKSPNIILLDEATSALDTRTERNIQTSLARICENRTSIIIAHRLSTIIHADEILVVRDGEIVERGVHEQLLDQQGLYADMWQQQLIKAELC